NSDALLLAAGQFEATLANLGIIALIKFIDKFVGVGGFGGSFNLFWRGFGVGVGNVFFDGAAKQRRLLENHADTGTQAGLGYLADVLVINADTASLGLIKAH